MYGEGEVLVRRMRGWLAREVERVRVDEGGVCEDGMGWDGG